MHRLRDHKAVEKCIDCGCKLSKNSHHHWRCHTCWKKYNLSKGLTKKDLKQMRRRKE